ncbi:thrombospondin type 3 repeat-containing protein [Sediminicola sp. 1XM1-17]|uniref:thrombospondin type 3 repeat-containing protein n=1 Tax=Sediminicola sp. 1XM1-17 TaxID=3127702 RepID=UPI00307855A3
MLRKLLLLLILSSTFSYGQFNESAPWMKTIKKDPNNTAKTSTNNYSLYEISDAFHAYWKDKDPNVKGSGYKPFMRWENYWKQFVDENGYLPSSKQLWDAWESKANSTAVANPTSSWTSLGPTNVDAYSGRLPGQGRVNAVAVDPNNANIWYVGAPAGGIWKSLDAGASWTNLFDDFPQIGVSGIAIDPNNSNIIYITTGDDDAADSYSVGVFKSTDGGASWNQTGLNPSNTSDNWLMNEIVIDPTNSQILWVGTNQGLYKSSNGGTLWIRKKIGNIKDFKLKPNNSNTIYAVTNDEFFKSTDGGEVFTEITGNLPANSGRLVLGVTPNNASVVYVLSADTGANDFAYQGLYKSTDSGTTFTKTPNANNILESNQAWFDLAMEVSPTDENEVYIGCLNIWKTTDGGTTFSPLNQWYLDNASYTHADIHTLKIFNGNLFCGSDGGVYMSSDKGTTFTDYTAGIAIGQFYRVSVSRNNASQMIGGLQDNGGQVLSDGKWNNYHGGDGMDNVISPLNDNLVYGFSQFGSFLSISNDAGQAITTIRSPEVNGSFLQGNWITPLAINSNGEVFAGYNALYKLNGTSWEKISRLIGEGKGDIEDVEIHPTNPMIITVAQDNQLHRSTDGGINFTLIQSFETDISDMALNNSNENIVYVATSRRVGISQNRQPANIGVYKIEINGTEITNTNITYNLSTDQAFFSLAHQGRNTDNPIYLGTSLGVYRLDDTLTEWEDYFTGLPSTAVSDLDISLDDEVITASTYGRGVWQSPIPIKVPENDLRLISLTPKENAVLCGEIIPEIAVENKGTNAITEVVVNYTVNGVAAQNITYPIALNFGESATIPLPPLDPELFGRNTLNVTASITNDAFSDNNTLKHSFFANDFGVGGTVNTFETAEESLITYNEGSEGSVWERGIPAGNALNMAASGQNVYATNLDGNHPDNVKGILLSNCYEFSSILAPVLKFKMAYDLEINFDLVYVQYSLDSGSSWEVLGNINSTPNWYNSDRTNANSGDDDDCQNCPGAQWTGANTELTEYAYDFTANALNGETDLTNEPNVIFRIVFQSDPAVTREGVVIDDFVVEGFQDDEDDDNDGVNDDVDNCPLTGNANQLDTDNNGIGDVCDLDDDGDGINDKDDNCPLIANADQLDGDNDGIGDVCDTDLDNDGVPNDIDLCDNTPEGAVVDVNGCEIFSLPSNNFKVLTTDESCISSNNGALKINALDASYTYTAKLTGETASFTQDFTSETEFGNLPAGNYSLCITIAGQAAYENCFGIKISEPEALSVSSKVNTLGKEISLKLSGGNSYTILVNEIEYFTTNSEITLPLTTVENTIQVKTDLDCQGTFEQRVILSDEVLIYPNPIANGSLTIQLGREIQDSVDVRLFTMTGNSVFTKSFTPNNESIQFNVDRLAKGIYLLNITMNNKLTTYKIIRK